MSAIGRIRPAGDARGAAGVSAIAGMTASGARTRGGESLATPLRSIITHRAHGRGAASR